MTRNTSVRVYQPTARQVARALWSSKAYLVEVSGDKERFFTWKSGLRAPVYCNCRVLFGHPGQRATVVRSIASAILAAYPDVNHIIGLAEAGTLWAALVAAELGQPVAYVSKTQKQHGIQGLVVGAIPENCEQNVKAVIVDDLVASGDTLGRAIETLKSEKGIVPIGIQSIVNWDFDKPRKLFERLSVSVSTLVSYPEILDTALEEGMLSHAAVEQLCQFYRDPRNFVWSTEAIATLCSTRTTQAM